MNDVQPRTRRKGVKEEVPCSVWFTAYIGTIDDIITSDYP